MVKVEIEEENEEFELKRNEDGETNPKETDGNEPIALEVTEEPDRDEAVQPITTNRPRRSSRLERDYKHFNIYGYGE